MSDHGATVVAIENPDLAGFREDLGVPLEAATCHSALIDEYVVQGHVPVEAIDKLLSERPDAIGVVVPGMPADSPGMGGDPDTWSSQQVLLIEHDGTLSPFDF